MTLQYAKTIRKKLQELVGFAHERELSAGFFVQRFL